jgi:hypothetical protein
VTSSSFITTTPLNVVSNTTQSFVPLPFEISFPPHAFTPSTSSETSSDSSLPSTLVITDEDVRNPR